jgi:1,4-alpha-glucan branching enzyme
MSIPGLPAIPTTPMANSALVDAAHAAGLYVILGIVLNHTGDVSDLEDL